MTALTDWPPVRADLQETPPAPYPMWSLILQTDGGPVTMGVCSDVVGSQNLAALGERLRRARLGIPESWDGERWVGTDRQARLITYAHHLHDHGDPEGHAWLICGADQ